MNPSVTFISSFYKTDTHIASWRKAVEDFMKKAEKEGLVTSIQVVANDPNTFELSILNEMRQHEWFSYTAVPRESFYASWNRGVALAAAPICTSWNVDDVRTVDAIVDGVKKIEQTGFDSSTIVYFPFIYKRYVKIAGFAILAKRKKIAVPPFSKERFTKEIHIGPFYLYTKAAFATAGPYDDTFKIAGDFEWQARAASRGCTFIPSDVVSGYFHNDGDTLSGSRSSLQTEEVARVINVYQTHD